MKEVYRSFEGRLGVDNRYGYTIAELKDFYELKFMSVYTDQGDRKVRIRKEVLSKSDFDDMDKISELIVDIENGCADYGQCWYKNKWYGYDAICKIQDKTGDYNWRRYV